MIDRIKAFHSLSKGASSYLEEFLNYSPSTIRSILSIWNKIHEFMLNNNFKYFNKEISDKFLESHGLLGVERNLSRTECNIRNSTNFLLEFSERGEINYPKNIKYKRFEFKGSLAGLMIEFIDYQTEDLRKSPTTIRAYKRNLSLFSEYCEKNDINSIEKIDFAFIVEYIAQLDFENKTPIKLHISNLKLFLKYLYEIEKLPIDISRKIPNYKAANQPKLPSVYTRDEIEKMIESVDQSSNVGKRNIAVILLAARLGIRASDISNLKLSNINWDTNEIKFHQIKTGKEVVLPLLADVGNAIINYLRFSRPDSRENYLFLRCKAPYTPFSNSNVVTHIVRRAFLKSEVSVEGRRHGPHALRHSLATRMLESETSLTVISEVLGHENSRSSQFYLRIDIEALKKCMIEIPVVDSNFYYQRGGYFYE